VAIDTTKLSAEDAAGKVLELVKEKLKADSTHGQFLT
jgi:hypothetical protein